ncbi:ABC transporter ATP-binding protein [Agromyces sp. NPDC049794]|uniref:ABC transporter ATP-binding protein n=1 Tax=unclassified Agromyces TaxID=2639701 RepID=UPI0034023FA8
MTITMHDTPVRDAGDTVGRLVLNGIQKAFGSAGSRVVAVDDFTLTVEPGEFVTFLGPSGCGKTTTLRMIAGFESPTAGSVSLDDEDMVSLTPDRRPMGMVFQSYALFPHMTVFENVAYGLKLKGLPTKQVKEEVGFALASMSLTNLANRAPNQLSGGQQQRVALARAMVVKPKVLLFDEPLSNLDAKLRAQMRLEIRRLQRRLGISSVYVTHDQDEAMSLSDRIVVMRSGRIEQVGAPDTIYRHPASVFVADFIGRANFLDVDEVRADASTGRASATVLGSRIIVDAHPNAVAGSDCVLLVRPESIRVRPFGDTEERIAGNHGRVLSAVFYGESVEYEIETEVGNIVAVVSDPTFTEIAPVGTIVGVSFAPERAWLLPAGD